MKLIFDHSKSVFINETPLIYLDCERENESVKYMFENGWVPYYENNKEYWYQTKSSRLKIKKISSRRLKELSKIHISQKTENPDIQPPIGIEWYQFGNFEDFYFDDVFWGRILYFEDQVLFAVMNKTNSEKSYGTLSYYYLVNKFLGKYTYLYITDFYDMFEYKSLLPGFEYWNGTSWI